MRSTWRPGRSVRANQREQGCPLPGDDLISQPIETLTHAITIGRPPSAVWPWLVQMGAGSRAGWYSYDMLDNGHRPSATRVVPELQEIASGSVFPALPGIKEGFILQAFIPRRFLVLGWPTPDGQVLVSWTFVLQQVGAGSTRLIVRVRAQQGYRFQGLPTWLSRPLVRVVHFVMQRKQLLGIAQRAESC